MAHLRYSERWRDSVHLSLPEAAIYTGMSIIALRQSLACRQIRFIALCPTVLDKLVASISARPPAGKRLLAKNVQLDISP